MGNKKPAEVCDGVAPAQQLESLVMLGRARIWPEAERTLAFAHGLWERGENGNDRGRIDSRQAKFFVDPLYTSLLINAPP